MHPSVHELLAVGGFTLSDFIFMVREHQIRAAAVNVKRFSEQIAAHCRAFNMPAGTAFAPFGIPLRFTGFSPLPKCKVQRILFCFFDFDTFSGLQFVDFLAG